MTNYFEDFKVGQRMRHARSATVGEVENNFISKQGMNTAQAHWNEHYLKDSPLGSGRVVFGLITGSLIVGLASQDTSEQALAEIELDKLRFLSPVHHGDTVTAFSEVLAVEGVAARKGSRLGRFQPCGTHHRLHC